jgi:anti-sigma factor RsiW
MDCKQTIELISAYADGELDSNQRAEAQRHIAQCAQCGEALQSINALKSLMLNDGLKFNAPGPLLKRVTSLIDKAIDPPTNRPAPRPRSLLRPKWIALAATGTLGIAALVALYLMLWPSARQRTETQAVASYQQSVQANKLVDITSADSTTVINGLAARLNFAPLLPIHPPVGYTLMGGRVDHFGGQVVATLVYHNGSHMFQIFQWPASESPSQGSPHSEGGLNVASWNGSSRAFAAVSDDTATPIEGMPNLFTAPGCGPQ